MIFVGPFFPDIHALRAQVRFVGIAGKKPKQFFGNPAEGNSLGRDDWKSLAQIETRLVSKMRDGADAGAVLMLSTVFENCFKNVVILFHKSRRLCRLICGKALPFRPALSVAFP